MTMEITYSNHNKYCVFILQIQKLIQYVEHAYAPSHKDITLCKYLIESDVK